MPVDIDTITEAVILGTARFDRHRLTGKEGGFVANMFVNMNKE